jgi:hypothetical protein
VKQIGDNQKRRRRKPIVLLVVEKVKKTAIGDEGEEPIAFLKE